MHFIRDAFTLPTWIFLGALLQSTLLLLLPTHVAILPVIIYFIVRFIDSVLIWHGMRPNPHMSGVVPGKTTAQFPGSTTPSQNPIVVIKLAARSNHPLGIFHPHMRTISSFFNRMVKDLDDNSERYDFLGASSYMANERATANEVMILAYFRTYEGLHAFAHTEGGVHREAWSYWNTEVMAKGKTEESRMFGIMHEVYQVPVGKWENIYVNYHPSGLGATTHKVNVHGQEKWASPLVDARKGLLRSSKGRMAVSTGGDNEIYGDDPYANENA
ncbi:uncharacterized protein N7498_001718 [Penicillium cinerascens]|uniref:Uncharacterized protein n=1 Tax=Penicillium cinerascens TaxID=70096 RepID=A0A9W9N8U6_9EURO|nr:uncharacterized protein N7498_001718 [Penicillium cinerascens]KAJ5215311.1 hypothetical protein N7498_001718 [Penicillium cinerascens]